MADATKHIMAKLDLHNQQLKRFAVDNSDDLPTGVPGQLVFRQEHLWLYDGELWVQVSDSVILQDYQTRDEKDQAGGYLGIGENGKVSVGFIPTGNYPNQLPLLKAEIRDGQSIRFSQEDGGFVAFDVSRLYTYRGTCSSAELDLITDPLVGDVWNLTDDRVWRGHNYTAGTSWAWEGTWSLSQSGADATVFTDLISTQWYYTGVRWAVDRGLMAGISGTVFSCNTSMTRAMMATVLYRYEGEPDTDYVLAFLDVPSGQWYSLPISWAADKGIVNGIGGGKFGLNNQITREQIATMLYRYAGEYRGLDVSVRGDLTVFPDADDVSAYAREALSWAVGAGIIGGSDGWLLPQDNATRAQVALMLQRFDALVS